MKRVTTNLSFGQLMFVLLTLFFGCGLSFYLGIKFGPQFLQAYPLPGQTETFLPSDDLMQEVKTLIAEANVDYSFFEVVKDQANYPTTVTTNKTEIPHVKLDVDTILPAVKASETPVVKSESLPEVKTPDKTLSKPEAIKPMQTDALAQVNPVNVVKATPVPPEKIPPKPIVPEPVKSEAASEVQKTAQDELQQTKYLLQIGSYSNKKKAEKARETWVKRGYQAEIVMAQIPGKGQWYKLRLGLFDDYNVIQTHQKQIQQKYSESAMILPIQ